MEMSKLDKVIKGLEICTKEIPMSNAVHKSDFCKECPYYNAKNRYCWNQIAMMRDALALLKEQQHRIEALEIDIDILVKDINTNNCNTCKRECEHRPRLGETVRANCFMWEGT